MLIGRMCCLDGSLISRLTRYAHTAASALLFRSLIGSVQFAVSAALRAERVNNERLARQECAPPAIHTIACVCLVMSRDADAMTSCDLLSVRCCCFAWQPVRRHILETAAAMFCFATDFSNLAIDY